MPSPTEILKKYWGYSRFRPFQEEIINSVLQQHDTLALLPTGGGKSLCYQLPSLLHDGLTLVVTPLIALMQDQVERLKSRDIPAAHISSGMHRAEVYRILNNAAEGAYKLLYVSPERLQTEMFEEFLPVLNLRLIAVDEAHCVSQWGHDFRPDYLQIKSLRHVFKSVPMLAVTASATKEVEKDIIQQLELTNVQVFTQSFERHNLQYTVQYSEQKNRDAVSVLNSVRGSSIVYCRSRKQTEQLSRQLQQNGINALPYHAGMGHELRSEHRELWMNNKTDVMVATTAFGMGIDKADVRLVLHYDVPEHLEAYYQESGRAGRDGQAAQSVLLYNQPDINKLEESTETQFPPYEFIRKVYQSVAEYLQIPIGAEPYKYYDFELTDFCKKFGLNAFIAARALKLLEQEGLWTLSEAVFVPTTVQVLADRAELDNISRLYHDLSLLLTTMLRLYGSLFYYPTPINIKVIAKHLKIKPSLVTQMLEQLAKMELIQFNQPKDGPQLFFHHYRVDSRYLIINTERINALKQTHLKRTNAMIRYITDNHVCRTKHMLQYFGQQYDKNCGHCDVCAGMNKAGTDTRSIREAVSSLFVSSNEKSIPEICSMLPQFDAADITTTIRQMVDDGVFGIKGSSNIYKK
ncbi:MAG TPA: RecQ family ATP-dependent DNA helicase [Flavipsychrobacter sp.]